MRSLSACQAFLTTSSSNSHAWSLKVLQKWREGLFCFLLALQIVSWYSATTRPLTPNDGIDVHQPGQSSQSLHVPWSPSSSSKEITLRGYKSKERTAAISKEAYAEVEISKPGIGLGSSTPSCDRKCYGCTPCEAIQVRATGKGSHVGLQDASYGPESWNCKCGPSFYTP